GRQLLETEMIVALGVTDIAPRVAGALLQEDRLDAALEEFEIERRRSREFTGEAHPQRDRDDHRQTTVHAPPPGSLARHQQKTCPPRYRARRPLTGVTGSR